ncbi:MAG: class A beta-lactamase-related serine hydrolase [Bernardetiaceae bacterium]|jgi:D-alanyl-D-alanine carboxypeptidase|nr:class A beta-lactamase-related serine hydrolase [Bernardetiaceae bacterium]
MLKIVLWGLAVLLGLLGLAALLGFRYLRGNADVLIEFIKNNPDKTSLVLIRNDTVLLSLRPDQKMPLASTVKTIVAIEYAQQAAKGLVNPQQPVDLAELERFYLPLTDGGAHPNWLKQATADGLVKDGKVPLEEVAKGMIRHSSNANTEYLMAKLGLANINANLTVLNLPRHDPLYPLVSALLVVSNTEKIPADQFLARCQALPPADYVQQCLAIHQKLAADADGSFKKTFVFPDLALQKVWSDRLPASTTGEYAALMQKIGSRTYFPAEVHRHLDPVMEWIFVAAPKNRGVYTHLGMKGGSTAFVLTESLYANLPNGDRVALAYFINGLPPNYLEATRLQNAMNEFNLHCIWPKRQPGLIAALAPASSSTK